MFSHETFSVWAFKKALLFLLGNSCERPASIIMTQVHPAGKKGSLFKLRIDVYYPTLDQCSSSSL